MDIPLEFKLGTRVLILLHRKKDGGDNEQRKSIKLISGSPVEWNEHRDYLMYLKLHCPLYTTHRLYASVNPRDVRKANYEFKRRQLESEHSRTNYDFYKDIYNRYFSCIASPSCKDESLFLLDCDTDAQYEYAKSLPIKITYDYATPNGRHIICQPFNPAEMSGEHAPTIHKDGMIYVG